MSKPEYHDEYHPAGSCEACVDTTDPYAQKGRDRELERLAEWVRQLGDELQSARDQRDAESDRAKRAEAELEAARTVNGSLNALSRHAIGRAERAEASLRNAKAIAGKVIAAQQVVLATYRAGGRTPENALDDLAEFRPQWDALNREVPDA